MEKQTLGADHPQVGARESGLGETYIQLGQFVEAKEHLELSLNTLKAAGLEHQHPMVVHTSDLLGNLRETFDLENCLQNWKHGPQTDSSHLPTSAAVEGVQLWSAQCTMLADYANACRRMVPSKAAIAEGDSDGTSSIESLSMSSVESLETDHDSELR